MNYKSKIENIKFSKYQFRYIEIRGIKQYDINCDFEKNFAVMKNDFKKLLENSKGNLYLKISSSKKTSQQNKAFHSAVSQLLPQYNEYLANHGADRFGKLIYNEDSFKDALKVEADYFREIKKEEALIYVKMNRQELKRLLPDATVEELVEARLRQKEVGRIRDATRQQMLDILKAVEIWAMDKGFSLSLEKESSKDEDQILI